MAKNLDINDGLDGIYVYGGNENNPDYSYNLATYGRLYTFDAAMRVDRNVEGWHLRYYIITGINYYMKIGKIIYNLFCKFV